MPYTSLTYPQKRWSLVDLFPAPDSPEMQSAVEELQTRIVAFEEARARLRPDISPEELLELIHQLDVITCLSQRLHAYAGLSFAENTQSQVAQTLLARMDQLMAQINNRLLFFSLWWKELDDENAARLMASAGEFRYWLETMRRFKPYTLSEVEEKIINLKDVTGVHALRTLYDAITNRYTFRLKLDGSTKRLTRGEISAYFRHPDAELRARAYRELYRVFSQDGLILGQLYQAVVRDWYNEQVQLRGFSSPISARNLSNDLPDHVVDTLLEVCRQNASLYQRYFRLKARWLGMERLRRYDVYAPVMHTEKMYEFGEAANIVLNAFHNFDAQLADMARHVFQADHLDSQVRKGKRSGAFCWSVVPRLTPWVMVNYQGRPSDVSTLAHELGHAVHSIIAGHHSIFTYHSTLPLAETASTFGEMLLVEHLLSQETDAAVRYELLFNQVDDTYATIMRQAGFALFERQAHEMVQQGASVDDLAEAYLENLRTQFGDTVDVSEEFRWEWVSIPHIYHTPFYVYAYAFGQLLVLSLYHQYKMTGESFKPRYLNILAAGGSESPLRILEAAGIDVNRAEFWQSGFDAVREMIEQLEAIPNALRQEQPSMPADQGIALQQ
ncbi:MAG: M3 family oligoendopeptidase [Anaerolineae bacterium]